MSPLGAKRTMASQIPFNRMSATDPWRTLHGSIRKGLRCAQPLHTVRTKGRLNFLVLLSTSHRSGISLLWLARHSVSPNEEASEPENSRGVLRHSERCAGREMAWYEGELHNDRLELPVSSWWITCITILVLALAVLAALF
jgi:hypothetical protein